MILPWKAFSAFWMRKYSDKTLMDDYCTCGYQCTNLRSMEKKTCTSSRTLLCRRYYDDVRLLWWKDSSGVTDSQVSSAVRHANESSTGKRIMGTNKLVEKRDRLRLGDDMQVFMEEAFDHFFTRGVHTVDGADLIRPPPPLPLCKAFRSQLPPIEYYRLASWWIIKLQE